MKFCAPIFDTINNNNSLKSEFTCRGASRSGKSWRKLSRRDGLSSTQAALVLVLAAILPYLNSLQGEFVHDDIVAIVKNPDVTGERHLVDILKHDFWGKNISDDESHKSFRPITTLIFRSLWHLGNGSPLPFHLTNVALHALVTWLFVHVAAAHVFHQQLQQLCAGMLFALHPVHTEAVSGIVGMADLLTCTMFLLAFQLFQKFLSSPKNRVLNLAVYFLFCCCATFSKEHGITVMGICLVLHLARLHHCKRSIKDVIFNKWLWSHAVLACFLLALRMRFSGDRFPRFSAADNPASLAESQLIRSLSIPWIWARTLWLLLCPTNLSYDWSMGSIPLVTSLMDVRNVGTLLAVMCICMLCRKTCADMYRKKARLSPVSLGTTLLIMPFIPASNLFFTVGFVIAERILYISSMGFVILLTHGLWRLQLRNKRAACFLFALLATTGSIRIVRRNEDWRSRETLFRSGLTSSPGNAKVFYNWGNYLKDGGLRADAGRAYKQAIRLWPGYVSALNNLALVVDNDHEAEMYLKEAEGHNPKHAGVQLNLAQLYCRLNKTATAIRHFESAILHGPKITQTYCNLVQLHLRKDNIEAARDVIGIALSELPESVLIYRTAGDIESRAGASSRAISHYQRALRLDPDNHYVLLRLAKISRREAPRDAAVYQKKLEALRLSGANAKEAAEFFYNQGLFAQARRLWAQVMREEQTPGCVTRLNHVKSLLNCNETDATQRAIVELTSNCDEDAEVLRQLAAMLGHKGRHRESLVLLEKIHRANVYADETLAEIEFQMADHHKDLGQISAALKFYRSALQLRPESAEGHSNAAAILHHMGELTAAEQHYKAALRLAPNDALVTENYARLQRLLRRQRAAA